MGRWRPPPIQSSPYITAEGAEKMKLELEQLWQLRRRDVVPAITAAAAEGDRSENAEYIYRKKQLGEIDRKIRYLSKRLDVMKVIDSAPANQARAFFGAWIKVRDDNGIEHDYRIVGADETGSGMQYISVDSPLAKALLGHKVGDEVAVQLPETLTSMELLKIWYSS